MHAPDYFVDIQLIKLAILSRFCHILKLRTHGAALCAVLRYVVGRNSSVVERLLAGSAVLPSRTAGAAFTKVMIVENSSKSKNRFVGVMMG